MALTKDEQKAVAEHREEYGDKHANVMAQDIEKGASVSQAHQKALKGEVMPSNKFTVKDYDRMIDDIMDEYFTQHDINFDMKELMKAELLGPEENIPEGALEV